MLSDSITYTDKDVLFIGAESAAAALKNFFSEAAITVRSFRFIDYSLQPEMLERLKMLDFTQVVIVKSEDCPPQLIPAPYTTITQLLMNSLRERGTKIIGITGTKGKTTTSVMLDIMLRQQGQKTLLLNDLTGDPFSLLKQATNTHIAILELSSAALADLEKSPDIAIVTNLYRDHLDYHGTLERYWEAKRNIMRFMTNENTLVFQPESEIIFHWLAESEAKQVLIDPNESVDLSKSVFFGKQNAMNYLLAKKAASLFGVDAFAANTALLSIKEPLPHRLQKVRTVQNITYINNAMSRDPSSTYEDITSCIREVGPVGCIMFGGEQAEQDYSEAIKILATLQIPNLILFPDTSIAIKLQLPENYHPNIFETGNVKAAVQWVTQNVPSGSVCLLSPGNKGLPGYKNNQEIGDEFIEAVMELSNL